uniref:Uncharacterized protein n=2 Tax=Caenorhabditis japonica TaxID=281687 RepID=A0A8R1IZT0_CAEJA
MEKQSEYIVSRMGTYYQVRNVKKGNVYEVDDMGCCFCDVDVAESADDSPNVPIDVRFRQQKSSENVNNFGFVQKRKQVEVKEKDEQQANRNKQYESIKNKMAILDEYLRKKCKSGDEEIDDTMQ